MPTDVQKPRIVKFEGVYLCGWRPAKTSKGQTHVAWGHLPEWAFAMWCVGMRNQARLGDDSEGVQQFLEFAKYYPHAMEIQLP